MGFKAKRVCAAIMCGIVACGSMAGCSQKTETNEKEVETSSEQKKDSVVIRVWGGVPEEAGPNAACEAFNEKFQDEGIQAEYVRFVNDDTGNLKLETTLLAGEGIDVFISYGLTPLQKRVEGNMTLDITEYLEEDGISLVEDFGELADDYRINEKDYCIPTKADYYGMVLNADMFEEAGIPIPTQWTYSEFREIANQLTKGEGDNKVYGAFLNTQQDILSEMGYFGVAATGADWMYKDGKDSECNFDDPIIKQSIQLYSDMMNVDQSVPSHTDSMTQKLTQEGMFLTGKCAMTIGPWMVRNIKDLENYPHDFRCAFAPYPTPDDAEVKYQQGGVGDLVSISSKTKNPDAAWEYVKWYATEGMTYMASGGRVPLYKGYDVDEVTKAFIGEFQDLFDEETVKSVLIESRDNVAVQTITTKAPELSQIFKEETEAVFTGQKSTEEAMSEAKARGDKILEQ